jgi:predicted nucleic acid-binding protein
MTYLLDVNALLALGVIDHEFHTRISKWLHRQPALRLATCAITELGFVRLACQIPAYGFTVVQAKLVLRDLTGASAGRFTFLVDDQGASQLPSWVKGAKQITDGHLVALASAPHATIDVPEHTS